MEGRLQVFAGNGNRQLAENIVGVLEAPLGRAVVDCWRNGETRVRLEENVRGSDVFIIQSVGEPVNHHLVELLIMIDAVRRSSAARITAVIPYFAYARQEKKTAGREPISAKLVANLLVTAGIDRILTLDLHAPAIEGFFDIPVDHLRATPLLATAFRNMAIHGLVAVSPDAGGVGRTEDFRVRANASLAIISKKRPAPEQAEVIEMVGDVDGQTAVIVDDMISTGGTLVQAADMLIERGAQKVYAAAVHGLFAGDAVSLIEQSTIEKVYVTDTLPLPPNVRSERVEVLTVAPLLAEAIMRIHKDLSISALFQSSQSTAPSCLPWESCLSSTNWIELVIAAAALLIVLLSAWAELSLAAVTKVDIRRLLDERLSREDALLIERTQRMRATITLVELLTSGIAVALITIVVRSQLDANGLFYGLLIGLAAVILFGRWLPRAFANDDPAVESPGAVKVARFLGVLFWPVIKPVELVSSLITRGRRRREEVVTADLLLTDTNGIGASYTEQARLEPHQIEEAEQDMISGILHLEEVTARQIMVPRIDIIAVSKDVLISEAVDVAIQAGHSRIPVYNRSIDDVLGIVYAKDLLKYVNEEHVGVTVEKLIRPAYIVPESKRIDDLLSELQQKKVHLAVVVDEYGGTAGVVTIEDILEEIVGEIQDEYDRELPQIEVHSREEAVADGRIPIVDLCDELDLEWPEEEDSGTLGGYIQRQLGRIPEAGESVRVDGLRLTVLEVEHRRIRKVQVERVEDDDAVATPDAESNEPASISSK